MRWPASVAAAAPSDARPRRGACRRGTAPARRARRRATSDASSAASAGSCGAERRSRSARSRGVELEQLVEQRAEPLPALGVGDDHGRFPPSARYSSSRAFSQLPLHRALRDAAAARRSRRRRSRRRTSGRRRWRAPARARPARRARRRCRQSIAGSAIVVGGLRVERGDVEVAAALERRAARTRSMTSAAHRPRRIREEARAVGKVQACRAPPCRGRPRAAASSGSPPHPGRPAPPRAGPADEARRRAC